MYLNNYNAIAALNTRNENIKFFGLFGNKYNDEILDKSLVEVVWESFNLLKTFNLNYFFESQIYFDKCTQYFNNKKPEQPGKSKSSKNTKKDVLNKNMGDLWGDIKTKKEDFKELTTVMNYYIEYKKNK